MNDSNASDSDDKDALVYVQKTPEVDSLRVAYEKTMGDIDFFLQGCRESYDLRRAMWPGKSRDQRKHGGNAFPWDGAADTEAQIINERINTYVGMFMNALQRASIRAYPVEVGDMGRAKVVSSFLKWMVSTYIPQFKRQMELGANHLLEKGIAVTYVGWQREDHTYKQSLTLEQLMGVSPDLVRMVLEGSDDNKLVEMLKQQFKGVDDKKAKKVLKDLRKTGKAEFPIVKRSVDCPKVCALAPDGDFIFPSYTTDPQQAPYCFWRVLMTAQELRGKIATEGWDEEWVEYVIEKCKNTVAATRTTGNYTNNSTVRTMFYQNDELYEVIYGYRRLIDEDDNSEGIYCTVFHSNKIGNSEIQPYAKHELLNGYEDYPVVVTKLSEDNKRLYDVSSVSDLLKGIQWQVKVERDSRIDRNSLATVPPIMHPVGNAPSDWGPGRYVPYRRAGEFQFGPIPTYNPGSMEMEQTQLKQADALMGLDFENPLSSQRQQYFINKFLEHIRDVLRLAYKCFQRYGPDEVFFRVTGVPDPQKFSKGDPDEDFDININFDVLNNDPENLESQLQQFVSLTQLDKNGRINMDALLDVMAGAINPMMADAVLQPAQEAQQKITKDVTDDLSKIYAGIEQGARPNGYEVAMQVIQQYVQQPDVMQRVQSDEAFKERLKKYMDQYSMMQKQAQNVQIGKLGTKPAAMGGIPTQGQQLQ